MLGAPGPDVLEVVEVLAGQHLLADGRIILVAPPVPVIVLPVRKVLVDQPVSVIVGVHAGRDDPVSAGRPLVGFPHVGDLVGWKGYAWIPWLKRRGHLEVKPGAPDAGGDVRNSARVERPDP